MATHLRPRARKQPGFFNDELDSAADDNDLFIVERLVARRKKKVRRIIQCNIQWPFYLRALYSTQARVEYLVLWQGNSMEECSCLVEEAMTFDADQ